MTQEILIIEITARPLAAVRTRAVLSRWPKEFMHTLNKVYAAIQGGHVRQSGHNVMVYHAREDGLTDIECGVETEGKFEPVGEVVYCQTPSGMAVTAAHIGPYNQLGATHKAVTDWARKNGYQLTGTCWEIYSDWDADEAKLRTDIFHQVRR